MRKIKFRAWDGREMHHVRGIHFDAGVLDLEEDSVDDMDTVLLMQYTGFIDRNGKDIYEGDILKDDHGRTLAVVWYRGKYIFEALSKTNFKYANDLTQWFEYGILRPKVVGNTYENPEHVDQI